MRTASNQPWGAWVAAGAIALSFQATACTGTSSNPEAMGATDPGNGDASPDEQAPTWHGDVAPLVMGRCAACHVEGGIGPFALASYEQAQTWASLVAATAEARTMPPFLAQDTEQCIPRLGWKHDLRLSDEEIAMLDAWARAGAPEGDPSQAAPLPAPFRAALERRDVVMGLPEPIAVDGTQDMHTCLVVDPGLERDTYVTSRLVESGNARVLHHVVSYVLEPGVDEAGNPRTKQQLEQLLIDQKGVGVGGRYDCFGGPGLSGIGVEMLDAWAPGALPSEAPEGSGQPLSKDSLVLMDMHYHPTGSGTEVDADTTLSLTTSDEAPAYVSRLILLGNFDVVQGETDVGTANLLQQPEETEAAFMIPAGAEDHVEQMTWQWKLPAGVELKVYAMSTHMHYVGYDMRIELEHAQPGGVEPDRECLIETPNWDFNWQRGYAYDAGYDELPGMKNGDVLHFMCRFNNSMSNPFVVEALAEQGLEAPVDVHLGDDTLDEMCLGVLGIMYPNL